MHYIYAGFSTGLNRSSLEEHNEIFLVKFGYSKHLQDQGDEQDWLSRMNDGFRTIERCELKTYGPYDTAPLAGFRDWVLVAKVCVGEWTNAVRGLEHQIDTWAASSGFTKPQIVASTWDNMESMFYKAYRQPQKGTNGHGQIYYIPDGLVLNLDKHMRENGINDPLADAVISKLQQFLIKQLENLAKTVRSAQR